MDSLDKIPANDVGRVVQDAVDDGAVNISVRKNADGTFRVTWEYK